MTEYGGTTVTDLLRQQHERAKAMFGEVDAATGSTRVQAFDCLRAFLAAHETAEEEVVHPAAKATGDEGKRVVEQRLAEEHEAKKMLSELEKIGPEGAGFDERWNRFKVAVLAHAEAEEHQLFPILEREKDQKNLQWMTDALVTAEKLAPTHAHPHAPESAIGNMLTGPFVAIADRVRDAIRGKAA